MSKRITSLVSLVAMIVGLSAARAAGTASISASAATTATATACFTDWSSALLIVQSEILVPVRDIHAHARALGLGEVMRVTLCRDDGRYVYRLLVRGPTGQMAPMTVDARKPF